MEKDFWEHPCKDRIDAAVMNMVEPMRNITPEDLTGKRIEKVD
jgi:hypothetical protein